MMLLALKTLARPVARAAWRGYSWRFNAHATRRYLLRERYGDPLAFDMPRVADPRFHTAIREYAEHRHRLGLLFREWVYDLQVPCYVEPSRGFVFGPHAEWLADPFGYHQLLTETPYRSLVSLMSRRHTIPTLDCAVSLRCFTEGNYWHFYVDLLSKLRLVDELDLPRDVPLLVGERLWCQPFFLEAITRGALRERNWMRHTATLRTRRLIVPVSMSLERANIEYALRAVDAPTPQRSDQRIFLIRGPRSPRALLNMPDILPTLHEFRFEIVDTAELNLANQMALFGSARLVVANHGAGLANVMFRIGQPLELIELFAPDFIHPHFVWMAHTFGFGYDALIGESVAHSGLRAPPSTSPVAVFLAAGGSNFRIDPTQFRAMITDVVARIDQEPVRTEHGQRDGGPAAAESTNDWA